MSRGGPLLDWLSPVDGGSTSPLQGRMDFILRDLSDNPAQREALWEVAKREALEDEADMQNASKQLKFLLAGGTWPNMLARISALLDKGKIKVHFIVLLKLNIEAAKRNRWKNKIMLFEKLEKFINNYTVKGPEALAEEAAAKKRKEDEEEAAAAAQRGGGFGMHTPVFETNVHIDPTAPLENGSGAQSVQSTTDELGELIIGNKVSLDVSQTHEHGYLDARLLSVMLTGRANDPPASGGTGSSKRKGGGGGPIDARTSKKNKRVNKRKSKAVLDKMAKALDTNGWLICDNFVSNEKAVRARAEVQTLEPHFELSEIWVGKGSASVGAHLRVPSVRGDKVSDQCLFH